MFIQTTYNNYPIENINLIVKVKSIEEANEGSTFVLNCLCEITTEQEELKWATKTYNISLIASSYYAINYITGEYSIDANGNPDFTQENVINEYDYICAILENDGLKKDNFFIWIDRAKENGRLLNV